MTACAFALPLVLMALAACPQDASASWHVGGHASAAARAFSMPAGNTPTATVSGRNVSVSWAQSSIASGQPVSGYIIERYDTNGSAQTIGSACSGTISALTCTENAVPPGTWKYSVTPAQVNWRGTESAQSTSVTVGSPSLRITSSTTVTGLPTTLNGNISNFISTQTVAYRLDNSSSGTVLSGTVSPSPVASDGNGSITVTIPAGTSNGAHTVYAIGSLGDVASAAITVSVPVARSFTTPAWTVSDQSGTVTDTSDPYAAAGGPYDFQSGFQTTFDTSRYLDFKFNNPLRAGLSTSGVNFNFAYVGSDSSGTVAANTCFYFEVRRISTGTVLATHGSTGAPVDCVTALTFKTVSTSLPEVSTTDIANDLEVRVYMTDALTGFTGADLGTVSGSEGSNAFTLNETQHVNQASGTPTTFPWSLNASGDGAVLTSANTWDTTFNSAKYLKLTFPAYTPSSATGLSGTFIHSYKSNTSSTTTCWYFEVYSSTTLLATHGSSSTPVSCNSTTSYVTNTVALPEINTVARANSVVIRIYAKNDSSTSSSRKSLHDRAVATVNYTG